MDPRGVLSSRISFDCFVALRVSLISIAKLIAFIRLANMSSTIMMKVTMRLIIVVMILVLVALASEAPTGLWPDYGLG